MGRSTTSRSKRTWGVSRPVPVSKPPASKKKSVSAKGKMSSKTKQNVVVDYYDMKDCLREE